MTGVPNCEKKQLAKDAEVIFDLATQLADSVTE